DRYEPEVLILVAGANPVMRPLQDQTWETFSVNWHTDVKIAFTWLREALLKPLPPGSRVVVMSSGAAIHGSPASGGDAGRQATRRPPSPGTCLPPPGCRSRHEYRRGTGCPPVPRSRLHPPCDPCLRGLGMSERCPHVSASVPDPTIARS